MFDWLFEMRPHVYIPLGAIAILALAAWWHLGGPWQPLRRRPKRSEHGAQSKRSDSYHGASTSHYGRSFRPLLEEVPVGLDGRKKKRPAEADLESGRQGWFDGPGLHLLLLVAMVALALIGLSWVLSHTFDTDRKDIERTVRRMAGSVGTMDLDTAYEHISERFCSPHAGASKEQFRSMAEGQIGRWAIKEIRVWEFEFPDRPDRARETKVNFQFKVIMGDNETVPFSCQAVFVWEPPGVWRMLTCRVFDTFHNNEEIDLQGF